MLICYEVEQDSNFDKGLERDLYSDLNLDIFKYFRSGTGLYENCLIGKLTLLLPP